MFDSKALGEALMLGGVLLALGGFILGSGCTCACQHLSNYTIKIEKKAATP
jgi:hypothetical protein